MAASILLTLVACGGVRVAELRTPAPAPHGACLVVGFLGGLDVWDDASKGVRRLALKAGDADQLIYAETFENRRVAAALALAARSLDADGDGDIAPDEAQRLRLVVYGQSLGGWAAVTFARLLALRAIGVHLLVQIDSVGFSDGVIPPNVRYAANLYQDEGWVIAGEHPVTAADTMRTRVLGNWEFNYDRPPGSMIAIEDLPWRKKAFRVAHARMDRDPRVWVLVERLVRAACSGADLVVPDGAMP